MVQNAMLTISQPGQGTREVKVSGPVTLIGRALDNAVCLEEDTDVSRYHAAIKARSDGFWLSDLGSRNGTTVNGDPVASERELHDGDLICIGGASTVGFSFLEAREIDINATVVGAQPAHRPPALGSADAFSRTESPGTAMDSAVMPRAQQGSSGVSPQTVMGVIVGLGLTTIVMGILFATGVIHGKKSPQLSPPPSLLNRDRIRYRRPTKPIRLPQLPRLQMWLERRLERSPNRRPVRALSQQIRKQQPARRKF